jgi:oligopeptide/dipeptide ABC transporter ATP-binding protein
MNDLLTVTDLRVRYPLEGGPLPWADRKRPRFVDVVHGVSLSIRRGETLAVVGESGSGKTTVAMALCGLAPVLGGEVLLDSVKVNAGKDGYLRPDRRRMALMLQDPAGSLSPRMTVRKLLAEPFRIHPGHTNDPERSAMNLLSMVGLGTEFADRYPHQLSGGQARRVSVARALALKPDLLIADEPTAGLDVSIQGEVLNLLADLQQEMGLGILIITHNLNIVRHVADQMAIMYLGRFLEQGASDRIIANPRHPYTAALLAANPSADPNAVQQRIELRGESPGLLKRPDGCEFHTRCPAMQPDCRLTFPATEGTVGEQTWKCFHPLPRTSKTGTSD